MEVWKMPASCFSIIKKWCLPLRKTHQMSWPCHCESSVYVLLNMSTIIAIITNIINIIAIVSILTPRIRYSYCCSVTEKPDVMVLAPVMVLWSPTWDRRLERPKGVKDEIKQARRAQSRPGSGGLGSGVQGPGFGVGVLGRGPGS